MVVWNSTKTSRADFVPIQVLSFGVGGELFKFVFFYFFGYC